MKRWPGIDAALRLARARGGFAEGGAPTDNLDTFLEGLNSPTSGFSPTAWGDAAQNLALSQLGSYSPMNIDVASIANAPPGYLANGPLPPIPDDAGGGGGDGGGGGYTGSTSQNPGSGFGSVLGGGSTGPGPIPQGGLSNITPIDFTSGGYAEGGEVDPDTRRRAEAFANAMSRQPPEIPPLPPLPRLVREGRTPPPPPTKKEDGGSLEDPKQTYRSRASTAVETPQPIDFNAQSAGPLTPENSVFASDLAKALGLTSPGAVEEEGKRLALSTAPAAVPRMTLPALAALLYGSSTTKAGESEGEPPPKGPAQLRLEQVMKDYEALQKRYDDAIKHRDLMLRGDPAMKIPPGQGPKTKAAEQVVNDLNEQLRGYIDPKEGLISQAQRDAQKEHQEGQGNVGNKLTKENPMSPWQEFRSDIMPGLGYPAGIIAGMITGHGAGRPYTAWGARDVRNADSIFTPPNPTPPAWRQYPARATRVDNFWNLGGSREPPFQDVPGGNPSFRSNPNQDRISPIGDLYRRSPGRLGLEGLTQAGLSGAYAYEGFYLAQKNYEEAKKDREAAEAAFQANPTKAGIEAVNAAKAREGMWDGFRNFGRTGAVLSPISGLATMAARGTQRPSAQTFNTAGSERRAIEAYLNRQQLPRGGPGGGGNQGGNIAGPQGPIQGGPLTSTTVGPGPGPGPGGTLPPAGASGNQGPTTKALPPPRRSRSSKGSEGQGKGNKPETEADAKEIYDPNDPSKLTRGQAHGGRVYRADGGAVHAGPIQNAADGGRTDTVPLDVASGSYVVPADIISGLGQGDTVAGYKVLSHMFGPQAPRVGPDGKTVPIMAAGGEYVLTPDAVARVGRGDVKAGHDALDAWVRTERRKHIMALKKLPGPARD